MNIQWIVLDVDGVLSDGTLILYIDWRRAQSLFCKKMV